METIDSGLDRDDTTYIDMLNDGGKVDEDRLTDFANFVGLLNQYSDPALLVSGTYDQQILNFSSVNMNSLLRAPGSVQL